MEHNKEYREDEIYDVNFQISPLTCHPNASELAKTVLLEEREIAADVYDVLYDMVFHYWLDDILDRENEINNSLHNKARELSFAHTFNIEDHPDVWSLFVSLRKAERKRDAYQNIDIHDDKFKRYVMNDFDISVKEGYVNSIIKGLLILIVETGYYPEKHNVMRKLNEKPKDWYEVATQSVVSVKHQYLASIVLQPSVYLPAYLHDKALYSYLFMNMLPEHQDEHEKKMLLHSDTLSDCSLLYFKRLVDRFEYF